MALTCRQRERAAEELICTRIKMVVTQEHSTMTGARLRRGTRPAHSAAVSVTLTLKRYSSHARTNTHTTKQVDDDTRMPTLEYYFKLTSEKTGQNKAESFDYDMTCIPTALLSLCCGNQSKTLKLKR